MLIGYPPPPLNTVALTNANWLTADAGAYLTDGQPARASRIQTTGTPSITLTFVSTFTPRVIALLGLHGAIQVGDVITATTGTGAALGGNAASQPVIALPDGSLACWMVTSNTVATATIKLTINRTGTLDIGEVVALPAVDIAHQTDWAEDFIDPSDIQRTRGQQIVTRARRAYRQLRVAFTAAGVAEVRGGALANGMDWQKLQAAIAGGKRVAAIPRWRTPAGAIDTTELHRTAIYGIAQPGGITHLGGNYYGSGNGWTFMEVPPL
jgi:hypothetical protein